MDGALSGFILGSFFQFYRSQHDIFQNGLVREQVEMLEYHTDVLTHFVDVGVLVCDIVAIHDDLALGCDLQLVQAAKKGRFTASGRSEQYDYFSFMDIHADIFQYFQFAKAFL